MTKSDLLELIKDYPDDREVKFVFENGNELTQLILAQLTEAPNEYIRFWFWNGGEKIRNP